jgi:leucyl aminopeptidase
VKIEFSDDPVAQLPAAALVAWSFEGSPAASGTVEELAAETRGLISELDPAEFSGKAYEFALLERPAGLAARRLLVVGAGKKEKFDSNQLRRVAGAAVRTLRARGIHEVTWLLENYRFSIDDPGIDDCRLTIDDCKTNTTEPSGPGSGSSKTQPTGGDLAPDVFQSLIDNRQSAIRPGGGAARVVEAVVEGAILADYDADSYRTERNAEKRIDRLILATNGGAAASSGKGAGQSDATRAAAERGRIIAEATNFTRDLVNAPSNQMTPTRLAEQAETMAARFGLDCQVLGPEEIRALKMGAFWSVAQGSDEPARLIVLRYFPAGAPAEPVIGLVGKGITFDTGGISIKPATDMHEMKTDMAGGATMLGVMRALAQLKPNVRVLAVVPATENMPSGKASKPGDVITSMSGKTIEILNTDAEGRLVLADGITYAKQQGATVVVDAATLTGAVTVALGNITTGVFGRDEDWVNRVLGAAAAAGERMWRLPVDDDYRDLYKSSIADLANFGGRYGGAIIAAMFVGEFAGDTPWVHLDIAGTRWSNEEKPYLAKGPTGHGVRTLVELLTRIAD